MKAYTITAGTDQDKDGKLIRGVVANTALHFIRNEAAKQFGGYTETKANGGWINPEGLLVEECSTVFTICADDGQAVREFASYVRETLNQHSVVFTDAENNAEFIES